MEYGRLCSKYISWIVTFNPPVRRVILSFHFTDKKTDKIKQLAQGTAGIQAGESKSEVRLLTVPYTASHPVRTVYACPGLHQELEEASDPPHSPAVESHLLSFSHTFKDSFCILI